MGHNCDAIHKRPKLQRSVALLALARRRSSSEVAHRHPRRQCERHPGFCRGGMGPNRTTECRSRNCRGSARNHNVDTREASPVEKGRSSVCAVQSDLTRFYMHLGGQSRHRGTACDIYFGEHVVRGKGQVKSHGHVQQLEPSCRGTCAAVRRLLRTWQ